MSKNMYMAEVALISTTIQALWNCNDQFFNGGLKYQNCTAFFIWKWKD